MAVLFKDFSTPQELEDFLNDRIVGSTSLDPMKGIDVRGLTLTFTTPAITVTFPMTDDFQNATPSQIVAHINSQMGGRHATIRQYGHGRGGRDSRIALVQDTDVFTGGTAAGKLGLVTGTVGGNAVAAANITSIISNPQTRSFTVWYTA